MEGSFNHFYVVQIGVQTDPPPAVDKSVNCCLLSDSKPLQHSFSAASTPRGSTAVSCSQDSDSTYVPSQSDPMVIDNERYSQI